jgi:hypothetical protein
MEHEKCYESYNKMQVHEDIHKEWIDDPQGAQEEAAKKAYGEDEEIA